MSCAFRTHASAALSNSATPATVRGGNAGQRKGRAHALQDVGGHQLVELRVQVLLRIHLPHPRNRPAQRFALNVMSSSKKLPQAARDKQRNCRYLVQLE